jgi:hypothetical protein
MDDMKPPRLLISAFAVAMLAGAAAASAQQYDGPPPFHYSGAEEAMEHRGYYDGVRGAERDFENHRRPNVNNRDEYRDPHSVPGWARHEYREGFRRGYYVRVREIYYGENPGSGHQERDSYHPHPTD